MTTGKTERVHDSPPAQAGSLDRRMATGRGVSPAGKNDVFVEGRSNDLTGGG